MTISRFPGSSAAEQAAVNRQVSGSNPFWGAILQKLTSRVPSSTFLIPRLNSPLKQAGQAQGAALRVRA